jgi:hypothetical protein
MSVAMPEKFARYSNRFILSARLMKEEKTCTAQYNSADALLF